MASLAGATADTIAPSVQLLADTNRDGKITAELDADGRSSWTSNRGALFLFNCDSDDNSRNPDWMDAFVNGDSDLEDLARLMAAPIPSLDPHSVVTVSVDEAAKPYVRIFSLGENADQSKAIDLESSGNIRPQALVSGPLSLGIEARTFATAGWNGLAKVTLSVTSPDGSITSDSVQLRVAPFILLSNLKKGETIYVREHIGRNEVFLEQLRTISEKAEAELHIISGAESSPYPSWNIWLQDTMEVGYQAMPGKSMNVILKANRNKALDNFARQELLGPDYGWFECGSFRPSHGAGEGGTQWMDWFGNLEVTAPIPGYPLGRVIYGITPEGDSLNPEVVSMLNAQGIQSEPLGLDVGWLQIKHVDEMISFVPTGPNGEFKVMVPDTGVAIRLLQEAQDAGNGATELLAPFATHGYLKKHPKVTVDALLGDAEMINYSKELQEKRIEPMIQKIIQEFGLKPEQLVRVPFLMESGREALIPNMVNSLVINGHLVIPDPNGPVINERDIFQNYMAQQFAEDAIQLHFVDDRQYHKWSGNVHCGTNVKREGPSQWWSAVAP
ncbi:MAG: protein-arginine deiminase family protein [Candidatus Sumerlaeia bacterium]|nr:protein-arginine deiminase family protein [Candidatus Sumerlaeia bacterium]